MKKKLFPVLSLAAVLKKQFSGNTIDAGGDIHKYRRGFLKLSGFLGLAGLMAKFGAGRALAQESEPAIPVYISELVISSYPDPGTVNLSAGYINHPDLGEMCQVTLLTKLPYGLKNADGSTTIVAEDGIALNPLQMVGTEYIDATPLTNEGAVKLTDRQEERGEDVIANRFSATINLYPLTGKSGFGKLFIDEVKNQDNTPNGISMTVVGKDGEVLMRRWVDKILQADPTIAVESNMKEDFYGVRRGGRKMKLDNQESSPFPEALSAEVQAETDYKKTLTDEQMALYIASKDMTSEGFTRRFLEGQLSTYIGYFEKTGEVAYVWNPEQGKINPALKTPNNKVLFINENSSSHMIWNPDNPQKTLDEEKKTTEDYMKYVLMEACMQSTYRRSLSNVLEKAIADPDALKLMEKGCNVRERFLSGRVRLENDQIQPNLPDRPQVYRMAIDFGLFSNPPDRTPT